jgi:hypothetical protein
MGAGSARVRWGLGHADSKGYNTWLVSSPPGYLLYSKHDFEVEDVTAFDLDVSGRWKVERRPEEDWGVQNALTVAKELPEGRYRCVMMKRASIITP